MSTMDERLAYADRVAAVWSARYRVAPITGRIAGYLFVCEPAHPSIDELAAALQASRSAVVGGVRELEARRWVRRSRSAGERADRVSLVFDRTRGFDPAPYLEAAAIAEDGLVLVADSATEQRAVLEETASLNRYLAEQLPRLLDDWIAQRADRGR
ncbi:MarR family transcriptional regulator [Microbacterium rhizosphaerae]|uniref:MarR family transcriptional regulator n=1 Tax=Microbacterium rhizosphaerae TaxID=1678237 RepID=A0ABZ0SP34_9MICO|nr:MarR family transcriptional regulator [Microbacterium rhizosphaerae]WPR90004.1 MarR family transcriptional regulator [Microbacterium rhizosphaerae]